jgi:hypothetical protein
MISTALLYSKFRVMKPIFAASAYYGRCDFLYSDFALHKRSLSSTSTAPNRSEAKEATDRCRDLGLSRESTGIPTRQDMLASLRSSAQQSIIGGSQQFDVLVIGGGCTGTGVALDATLRGLKVACVDRDDFASETSAKSTKLLWGGSRYLANALGSLLNADLRLLKRPKETINSFYSEFKMVLDCHRERRFMLQEQPHLTNWIPLVVPFKKWYI